VKPTLKYFQILLLLIAGPAWGQIGKPPDGFLNLKWGATVEEVRTTLLAREGVTFKRDVTDGYLFSGGTFAGHPVGTWAVYFYEDKLNRAQARLAGGNKRAEVLQAIKKELMDRYGAPARNYANGQCRWVFPRSATHPFAEAIELTLDANSNEVFVSYICESPIPTK
jgi:hypothetical protein